MFFYDTVMNPDCVRFQNPFDSIHGTFASSFYNLAQDNVTYSGGLTVFSFTDDLQFHPVANLDLSAVFDFQWVSADKLLCASVQKKLELVDYKDSSLSLVSSIELSQKPLFIDLDQNSAFVSEENGHISIVSLETGDADTHKIHDDNVWMIRKNPKRNLLISGSDDCNLVLFDLNQNKSIKKFRPIKNEKESGITSIQIDSTDDENIFFIGTYEKQLQVFDMRNLAKPITAIELPGGVWRMSRCNDILACGLSYGKCYELLDIKQDYSLTSRGNFQGQHDSLLYGIDIKQYEDKYLIISCSFYDRKIACNSIPIN